MAFDIHFANDRAYPTAETQEKPHHVFDVWWPKASGRYPALVLIHGGGWFEGDESIYADLAPRIAETGVAVYAVRYQLATEAEPSWPHCLNDIALAVGSIRDHDCVDANNIYVAGESAGGHLALMLAVKHPELYISGVVSIDGVIDLLDPPLDELRTLLTGEAVPGPITDDANLSNYPPPFCPVLLIADEFYTGVNPEKAIEYWIVCREAFDVHIFTHPRAAHCIGNKQRHADLKAALLTNFVHNTKAAR